MQKIIDAIRTVFVRGKPDSSQILSFCCNKTVRILIVEENRKYLKSDSRMLRKLVPKAEIVSMNHPNEAFELEMKSPFDIVFVQMEMTELHGLFFCQKLVKAGIRTNMIFIAETGDYALDGHHMRVSDYLLRPVTEENMRLSLENLRYPVE